MSKKNIIFGPIKEGTKPNDLLTTNQKPNNAGQSLSHPIILINFEF